MAEIVTTRNATEYKVHQFATEASTIGLRPGMLADQLRTELGNGMAFVLTRVDGDGTFHYQQQLGCITLEVYND